MQFPFSHLTGRGVRVAVVDSGIVSDHPKVGAVAGGVSLRSTHDGTPTQGDDFSDCSGHGTACAGIIRRKATDAAIFSVRIFDESLYVSGHTLIAAIEWGIANCMDIINLSLGTTDVGYRDAMAKVCRKAVDNGVILVAAEHNDRRESYPALLSDVIGVGGGALRGLYHYHYRPGAAIECIARSDPQRVCWLEPPEIMLGGNSFAAPHITGLISLIRQAHPGAPLRQVRDILRAYARPEAASQFASELTSHVSSDANGNERFAWVRRAALCPYNKEMHSLMRGRGLLAFDIVGVADIVGKGLVGRDAGEVLGLAPSGLRIAPRLSLALEGADTLILGYVDELSRIRKKDLLRECIQTALERGIHVFSLMAVPHDHYSELHEMAEKRGLHIYFPELTVQEAQKTLDEATSYSEVDKPVLAVVGTGPQQGKFTLQLAMRRQLMGLGYRVGQVGTEHHAELFGMDCSFPMGYAASVRIPLEYYAPFLDAKMREVCHRKQPHLLLVGTQSGTVPFDVREHRTQTLSTIAFLMGVTPDACVLVVNSVDDHEYIQDTIDGIRALCQAPTLMLAMPDQEKHIQEAHGRATIKPRNMDDEEMQRNLKRLESRFEIPAICITSPSDIQSAVNLVVEHFAVEENSSCEKEKVSLHV